MEWVTVAIQASGALGCCAMFLWFLQKKQVADEQAREKFLAHLLEKDKASQIASNQMMEYLQTRDAQSKEIALSGHAALAEVTSQLQSLTVSVNLLVNKD